MSRPKTLGIILLTLLRLGDGFTQVPGMHKYTQFDGYSGRVGYRICQDNRGFIWIGTINGAVCFDGNQFTTIDDETGVPDKEILAAIPDYHDHTLLVPLLNHLSYYYHGRVITSKEDPGLARVNNKKQNLGYVDPFTHDPWIFDIENRKYVYHFHDGEIRRVPIKIRGKFKVWSVINDQLFFVRLNNGRRWRDLEVYDLKRDEYRTIHLKQNNKDELFSDIIQVSRNGYVVTSSNQYNDNILRVYRFTHSDTLALVCQCHIDKYVSQVIIDDNNQLWVTFEPHGVAYFGDVARIGTHKRLHFLNHESVNGVFVDRDKNTWLTSNNNGLYFISEKHFRNLLLSHKYQLEDYETKAIAGNHQGLMYAGYHYPPCFSVMDGTRVVKHKLDSNLIHGIRQLYPLSQNSFIIADNNLAYVTIKPDLSAKICYLKRPLYFKDIASYGKDSVLAASAMGVYVFPLNIFEAKNNDKSDRYHQVFNGRSTSVESMPDKSILIGTPNGLFKKKHLDDPAVKVSHAVLQEANIVDIVYAKGQLVLVGTSAQGLFLYNYITGSVTPVSEKGPNTTAFISQVYKQDDSTYWLATSKGACQLLFDQSLLLKVTRKYTFFEGLPSDNVTSIYTYRDTAYVAVPEGIGTIPLKDTSLLTGAIPSVYITTLKLEDTLLYYPQERVNLDHNQNNLQVRLSTISYESLGNTSYLYQLEGLSLKWISTNSAEISFTGLPPGDYMLHVYAVNHKGVKSKDPVNLALHIYPAFWQTIWFRFLLILLGIAVVGIIIYKWAMSRKSAFYAKAQQQRRLAELELEAIKAQINPHFIYNCLNSIQCFNHTEEYESATHYLDLFATLIRKTMHYSQEAFISIEEEIDYLTDYLNLEKLRFKEKLNYKIDVDAGIEPHSVIPAMLIQPYVENALKHGISKNATGGTIRIKIAKDRERALRVTIEDDGPGLVLQAVEKNHKLGMRLSATRASTYNQLFDLGIEVNFFNKKNQSAHEQGTIVQLFIPHVNYEGTKI